MKKNPDASGKTLKKTLQYLRPSIPSLLLSAVLALGSVAGMLYVPILVGDAIDAIGGHGGVDFRRVAQLLLAAGAVAGGSALAQWGMGLLNNRIVFHTVRDVRNRAFKQLQQLPLSYLDAQPQGELVSRIIADADQFADGLLMGFSQLFTGVITILGTLVFMFCIQWKIALVVVLLTPLSLLLARFIAARTYRLFRRQSELRGEQTAYLDEMLGAQKVVRAFSHEKQSQARFDEINDALGKCSLRALFYSTLVNPSTRFLNSVVYAAVALAGSLAVLGGGAFTVGALSCFLSYANQYAKPFNEISGVVAELQNAMACAARLFDLIAQPPQKPDDPDAVSLTHPAGSVTLENVCFSYVPQRPLIEALNLKADPGQRIAIVGPTGCGKTTLINLLMRFYDVDAGRISVDGCDIRHATRQSLRASYGMVLQDTWLQNGTVRENLRFGKPDATEEELREAAKKAHADGFIRRLPDGYDTVLSEDGGSLSQGQKQLLCIARVMLCLPPMLILDEATSSIDTRTEMKIQQAFNTLMQGRTSFIVAHRLSTIREADRILVMKDGRIIEQGTHTELLEQGGFYASLYNSQFAP
jgi:ATP-binding cassette subfamily B protein